MENQQSKVALDQAIRALQSGQPQEAKDTLSRYLMIHRNDAQAHFLLGVANHMLRDLPGAIQSFDRAIGLNPKVAEPHFNRGLILHEQGRFDDAVKSLKRAATLGPSTPQHHYSLGLSLYALGRYAESVPSFQKAIALKSDYFEAYCNYGNALFGLKRFDDAIVQYDRALVFKNDFPDIYFNRGNAYRELQNPQNALADYDRAIALFPAYAEAYSNRGVALFDLRRFKLAIESHTQASALKPDSAEIFQNLGNAYLGMGKTQEAVASYDRAIALKPQLAEALLSRGDALRELRNYDQALESYAKALEINPDFAFLLGAYLHCKLLLCDWRDFENLTQELQRKVKKGKPVILPFNSLSLFREVSLQRRAAEILFETKLKKQPRPKYAVKAAGGKIKLGYFSAEFHNHAVMLLTAELFELHDRAQFEVIGISHGPSPDDDVRARVSKSFDQFVDMRHNSDQEIVAFARETGIDIAIDLTGHTLNSRVAIFSKYAAPLQIQYLGFPGGMGADFYDYMIADTVVVPQPALGEYVEKAIYMPECFQVNDRARVIGATPTRLQYGIPDSAFVFCSFNNTHKINPENFKSWLRILYAVENSVLWLVGDSQTQIDNLKSFAANEGLDPARLIFAKRVAYPDHLARYRLVDLVLDTLPFNGGVTTSDALWAGAPVLSQLGETYAGRMAGSLLHAVGLPEMIVNSPDAYEARAIELATSPQLLKSIRQKLQDNRLTCPLFDSQRFARHLEAAYIEIWRRHQAGLRPDHIHVAAQP